MRLSWPVFLAFALPFCTLPQAPAQSATTPDTSLVHFSRAHSPEAFPLALSDHPAPIVLEPSDAAQLSLATCAFAADIQAVTGTKPAVVSEIGLAFSPDIQAQPNTPALAPGTRSRTLILVGVLGASPALDALAQSGKLDVSSVRGQWESALTTVVQHPFPGVDRALVIAGADRRGTTFALFTLSRQMGVSPWTWWADVPVKHHTTVFVEAKNILQPSPTVQYRGIFLNDEDWGLRPWAAKKMDLTLHNIGPNTYGRIFELLLRLHANSLWPAMHLGTLPFNDIPENAQLADRWGIVMGSSHSEALLRDNLGEWNEAAPPKGDGPWNYQLNRPAMIAYWDKRLATNGRFENFYTVGLRGVHDTGLEATGDDQVKARIVEQAIADQRKVLAERVSPDLAKIPQVIWLYKESLELFRAGMQVPPDVTLGWTDDNYGYIRQLPTPAEQQRPGGSGVYYHVSYWGFPHDYLWLCSTPPALIREEMTKAYDHNARRYWVLNVGDLKPAESDIDYFMQLAWNEPAMAKVDQLAYLTRWSAEQFPPAFAPKIARILARYYQLNFVRKPEFMGFNGYNDSINRTAFNPLAWGNQNQTRLAAWQQLSREAQAIAAKLPPAYQSAYFELVGYPVQAAAAMNAKFLFTDRTYLPSHQPDDAAQAHAAYDRIQSLTYRYNHLENGKWDGIMSSAPRNRHVFEMPATANGADLPLPATWGTGKPGTTLSIPATHFTRKQDGATAAWTPLPELGISGSSIEFGRPGLLANAAPEPSQPWLEYSVTTENPAPATLAIYLLPTFPLDSDHRLAFGLSIDGAPPVTLDAGASGEWHEDTAPIWAQNVLRNAAVITQPLGPLAPGHHTLRLLYRDPGVIFEHLVIRWPGSAPAYPVPPS
jgi:hypothetical protein